MTSFLESLIKDQYLSTLVVLVSTLLATFQILFRYKAQLKEAVTTQAAVREDQAPQTLDNLSELLVG